MTDYLEADYYFCGKYMGKKKFHKDSLLGCLARQDYRGYITKQQAMKDELEKLGAKVTIEFPIGVVANDNPENKEAQKG